MRFNSNGNDEKDDEAALTIEGDRSPARFFSTQSSTVLAKNWEWRRKRRGDDEVLKLALSELSALVVAGGDRRAIRYSIENGLLLVSMQKESQLLPMMMIVVKMKMNMVIEMG
jgi:hypothetical protein